MNFMSLKRVIIDAVKEFQMKLGYSREIVRLYYPADALSALLECTISQPVIDEFTASVCAELGKLRFTETDGRYCIIVPPEGVEYIHNHIPDSPFQKAFFNCISRPGCTLKELTDLFQSFAKDVVLEEQEDNGDTEHILYFAGGDPDPYCYCVHEEMGRITYHRFTRTEYERLWRGTNGKV